MEEATLTLSEIEEFRQQFGMDDWMLAEVDPRDNQIHSQPDEAAVKVMKELDELTKQ